MISHSTVGLPRESRTSRAWMFTISVMPADATSLLTRREADQPTRHGAVVLLSVSRALHFTDPLEVDQALDVGARVTLALEGRGRVGLDLDFEAVVHLPVRSLA